MTLRSHDLTGIRREVEVSAEQRHRGQGADEPANPSMLVEYLRTISRRRWLIASLAAAGLVLAVLLHLTTQPVYRSRTSLDIQSINGEFMNMRSLDPTSAATSGESMIQTQIKLLQSDTLLDRVQRRLSSEPHASAVPRMDLLSRAERLLHLPERAPIPYDELLDETSHDFKVKPLGITRLVEITCDSWDPAFAARFCNALTSEFQDEDLESRGANAKHTSDWLTRQAADIKEKAIETQQKLVAATGGNGLILGQQSDAVGADRLRQMQGELVKAQADRMEKEAETAVARNATPDSSPSVAGDAAYAAARTRLADLQAQVAAIVPPLTEANPRVIHLRAQIQEVKDEIARERGVGLQRLQGEYNAAKHRENLLALAYHAQEQNVSSDLQKGSQVALLRRELESEQQLYETLLQRAKEAGFASAMQASTIRIVDAAKKPLLAVYPQRIKADIVGLLLGAFAAIVWSLFRERSRTLIHLPRDSERYLQLTELGVIPSPRAIPESTIPKDKKNGLVLRGTLTDNSGEGSRRANVLDWKQQFSLATEAYRSTTLSLMSSSDARGTKTFIVSSPNAGEGKTTVTANLGVALAKSRLRVVLVDGDLRKPNLHRVFHVPNSRGLRNVLRGDIAATSEQLSAVCHGTEFPNLSVIPAGEGEGDAGTLAHSEHFRNLMRALQKSFDVILVDTPPMLHIADARIFAGQANGAILIFRSGVTTLDEALTARDSLDRDRIRVVGSILNDFDPQKHGKFGYYESYYAYHKATGEAVQS